MDVTTGSEYEVAGLGKDYLCTVYSLPAIFDTVQRTSSVSYYWTTNRKSDRGSMLGGYKQLKGIAQSVLPALNQIKTLFFTQYLYYTMALSTIGNYSCL